MKIYNDSENKGIVEEKQNIKNVNAIQMDDIKLEENSENQRVNSAIDNSSKRKPFPKHKNKVLENIEEFKNKNEEEENIKSTISSKIGN